MQDVFRRSKISSRNNSGSTVRPSSEKVASTCGKLFVVCCRSVVFWFTAVNDSACARCRIVTAEARGWTVQAGEATVK